MKNIRMAQMDDLEKCTDMFNDSFFDYDFTKVYECKNEVTRKQFYRECFHTELSIAVEKNEVLILEEDGVFLALAHLKEPGEKDFTVPEYITHGVLEAFRVGGLKNGFGFIKLLELSEAGCKKIEEPHWYLAGYAVNKDYHEQGIGSYMLKEGVFPYIKERGGKLFSLVTNSEYNEKFYQSNGFKTIKKETIQLNGKEIGNWTMVIEL